MLKKKRALFWLFMFLGTILILNASTVRMKLKKAEDYLAQDNFKSALTIAKLILKKNPDNYHALKIEGICYMEMGKPEKGKKILEKALKGLPQDSTILNYLANYYEALRYYPQALEYFKKAIRNKKEDLFFIKKVGELYRKMGEYFKALQYFKMAKKIKHDEEIDYQIAYTYFLMRNLPMAENILKIWLKKKTKNPKILELWSIILQAKGKFKESLKVLQKIGFSKRKANFFKLKGIANYKLKKYPAARAALKMYLKSYPYDSAALTILFNIYAKQKKYKLAEKTMERLLSLKPKKATLYLKMGDLYVAQEKYQDALSYYRAALPLISSPTARKQLKKMIDNYEKELEKILQKQEAQMYEDEQPDWKEITSSSSPSVIEGNKIKHLTPQQKEAIANKMKRISDAIFGEIISN